MPGLSGLAGLILTPGAASTAPGLLFGTVTSMAPLQVQVDGSTTVTAAVAGLETKAYLGAVGARVLGIRVGARFYITDVISSPVPLNAIYEAVSSSGQSIANNTPTVVTGWTGPTPGAAGTPGAYFTSYSTGVWTFAVPGVYDVEVFLNWSASATTNLRSTGIFLNGAQEVVQTSAQNGNTHSQNAYKPLDIAAGDTLDIRGLQLTGVALTLNSGATHHITVTRRA